jgi:hypothetical protein
MLKKLLPANSTTNTAPNLTQSATIPTGANVIVPVFGEKLRIIPYGTGDNNSTATVYVYGWNQQDENGNWHATLLGAVSAILSQAVGISGGNPSNTERYADTLTLLANSGLAGLFKFVSNALDQPGIVEIDTLKYPLIQVVPIIGTATNVNALYEFYQ